ncbi:MAG TPA: alpha-ketoglutarate-dependent dioxygenase AlkB [Gemmataceae bacterium]|nr:alpha-ketoglutarate-dependent dioxygenase AlkB [Gemmataceae bacterium]
MTDPVPRLRYLPDWVAPAQEEKLLRHVDESPWMTELRRRVQHYGWRYDYRARAVDLSMRLGPLPDWAAILAGWLVAEGLAPEPPDQVIVNAYEPGQGIAAHVDCVPCFTETIMSLSLGSACVMSYKHKQTRQVVEVPLLPRSLLLMSERAEGDFVATA